MREPAPDFSSGPYERVNQPWVCGQASAGAACPAGPSARGECPALAECTPLREGDRWQCNRLALRGGPCTEGPTPDGGCGRVHRCRPVRSLRAVRGRFVAALALLTLGLFLIALSSNDRDRLIAPGPLASPHAQLLAQPDVAANCSACHAAAQKSVAGWMAMLVAGHAQAKTQSELCIQCHGNTIAAELALLPHNVNTPELNELTSMRAAASHNSSGRVAPAIFTRDSQLACATCHIEHQGPHADLTAMDNAACQVCHYTPYGSFATDHPDFGAWPYERRTQIAFNHASHKLKHFAGEKQAFDCRMCHYEDATQSVQLTAGYEAACAGCHDEKIATSVAQGVPMLVVPTLDVEALRAAGQDIGHWPEAARGEFDGRLPPPMKLLLAGDAPAAKAMTALGPDFDFFDVDPDDDDQLAATAELAGAIKRLFGELSRRGPAAVRERLSAAIGREVASAEVVAPTSGLSAESLHGAAEWMSESSAAPEKADGAREFNLVGLAELDPPYGPAGAWIRDDATLSLRYRPAVHADPVLTGWLQLLAVTPNLVERPLALAMFNELSSPTAAGLCASCHSVEQTAQPQELAIHWAVATREPKRRRFTKFTHRPHLILPQLADCTQCHAVNGEAASAAVYVGHDPHRFVSDFVPMSKRHCAECHTAAAAGDACQSCHNYHLEAVSFEPLRRPGTR